MGTAVVKFKLMPISLEADLEKIKLEVNKILKKEGVQNPIFEEKPIAFGLKAIETFFGWPEEKPLEELEEFLKSIKNVNSVELIDIRRAIG